MMGKRKDSLDRGTTGYIAKVSVVLSLRGAERRSNLVWLGQEIASLPSVARNDRQCCIYRQFWDIPGAAPVPLGPAGQPLRRLVTEDRGTTLTEVLVTIFIMSLLFGLLGTAFYQFFTVTTLGNDTLTALHDLEIAGVWLSRDAREARSFTPGSGTVYGTFDCGDSTVQYSYDSENTALVRTVDGRSHTVASHIAEQNDVQFSVSGSLVTITLTSTSGAASRNTTLKINMRTD